MAVVLGAVVLLGDIGLDRMARSNQEHDRQDIALMRQALDSAFAKLGRATTAPDSAALLLNIRDREAGIDQREYHVPRRQADLDAWWGLTGVGTLGVVVGALFVLGGVADLRRRKGTIP